MPEGRVRGLFKAPTSSVPALRVHSYYSFLDSTLSPKDIVHLAVQHHSPAVAITDTGNLHGVVEFVLAAQEAGIKPILGVELRASTNESYNERRTESRRSDDCVNPFLNDRLAEYRCSDIPARSHPLLLYVENARGYANLCKLLSQHATSDSDESVAAQQAAPIPRHLLESFADGLIAVSGDPSLAPLFPGRFYQIATAHLSSSALPAVAAPWTCYAAPADRPRFDIVQSIRTRTLLRQRHPQKRVGGRYHFRTPPELTAGCADHPDWLDHAREIADRCQFDFPFGKPQFPTFRSPDGASSKETLRRLVTEGMHRRYHHRRILSDTGATVPLTTVQAQIETELAIIAEVGYEDLFLITWDLLQTCRSHGIEWITRGSAADSLVCYCLGISDVCPIRFGPLFPPLPEQGTHGAAQAPGHRRGFPSRPEGRRGESALRVNTARTIARWWAGSPRSRPAAPSATSPKSSASPNTRSAGSPNISRGASAAVGSPWMISDRAAPN